MGSSGTGVLSGNTVYLTSDTGGGPTTLSQIQGILSLDAGAHWGSVIGITNDSSANNFNPYSAIDSLGDIFIVWARFVGTSSSVMFVKLNYTGVLGTPINLGAGSDPRIVIDGNGNLLVAFTDLKGNIDLTESKNSGASFGTPSVLVNNMSSFLPLIAASGSKLFIAYQTFGATSMPPQTFPEEGGLYSPDDGTTWLPFPLHIAKSTDSFQSLSAFFVGSGSVVADIGANELGSSSGTLAFADFGDATGTLFNTNTIGSNFLTDWGFAHSDGTVLVAAVNALDGSPHLLWGKLPTTGFSDLKVSSDMASQVSIFGDDSKAFIVETTNGIPGPIKLFGCH